jgi:pimeloyl-ACP methyl ester carboxylesterase
VAGLGSTDRHAAVYEVPTGALGYDAGDVVHFSYRGGHLRAYTKADSQQDLRVSGERLADLIEEVAAERPGVPIDLLAHSQGGLVSRLALIELEERHGRAWLDRLGLFATLATPHHGADLATAVHAIDSTSVGDSLLDQLGERAMPGLDPSRPAAAQLSETSDLIRFLDDHPLPVGLHALSVAARGDIVVPVPRTQLAGATEVIVPVDGLSAHDQLPGSPEVARELALALSGAPPTCTSFTDALEAETVGAAISRAEDHVGAHLWPALGALEVLGPLQPDDDGLRPPDR